MEDVSNYEKLREDAQKFYSGIGKVSVPALNQEVFFNAEGFNHIVYKSARSAKRKNISNFKIQIIAIGFKTFTKSDYLPRI